MTYQITKTYGHNLGLSACFRNHKTETHCKFLHGYALSFKLTFEADTLDDKGWVLGFGNLKPIKAFLEETFDHRCLVAYDDPALEAFRQGHKAGLIDMLIVPRIGCEAFAELVFNAMNSILYDAKAENNPRLVSVECREHEGNSAIYFGRK